MRLCFLGGLPRSGSTLLANVLAQNPKIHATASSGLIDAVRVVRDVCDNNPFFKAMPDAERQAVKLDMVRGLINGRFHGRDGLCIDKNRGWPTMFEFMCNVLGGKQHVKAVVCVRDLRDVLASFESLYRRTLEVSSPPQQRSDRDGSRTALGRAQHVIQKGGPVGYAIAAIQDAQLRGWGPQMHFVDYAELCSSTHEVLGGVYEFLELSPYDHDLNNIEQQTREDDGVHGFVGLHDIRSKIEIVEPLWPKMFGPEVFRSPMWQNVSRSSHFWTAKTRAGNHGHDSIPTKLQNGRPPERADGPRRLA